jgi:hypothetical protein
LFHALFAQFGPGHIRPHPVKDPAGKVQLKISSWEYLLKNSTEIINWGLSFLETYSYLIYGKRVLYCRIGCDFSKADISMSSLSIDSSQKKATFIILTILRVAIGWHFLYEGLTKLFNPAWTAAGYLESATGPLAG